MASGYQSYSTRYDNYTSDEYPPDWQARRKKVLKRDGYTCQACGVRSTRVDNIRFDVHHIIPKSDGGNHSLDNLQALCPSCHANKHPGNTQLKRRGRQYARRNKPSLLIRMIWFVFGQFLSSVGPDERSVTDSRGRRLYPLSLSEASALPEESGVTVEVSLVETWESSSENVQQLGRVEDVTYRHSRANVSHRGTQAQARFVIWTGNSHPRLKDGQDYRIVGAKTNSYNGEFQLVIDGQTAIQTL